MDLFLQKLGEVGATHLDGNANTGSLMVQSQGLNSHSDGVRAVKKALDRARDRGMVIDDGFVLFVPIDCASPPWYPCTLCMNKQIHAPTEVSKKVSCKPVACVRFVPLCKSCASCRMHCVHSHFQHSWAPACAGRITSVRRDMVVHFNQLAVLRALH